MKQKQLTLSGTSANNSYLGGPAKLTKTANRGGKIEQAVDQR